MDKNVTRGGGLLEAFLAKQRAQKADSLIPHKCRNGRILDIGCGSYPFFLKSCNFKEKHGIDQVELTQEVISLKSEGIFVENFNIEEETKLPFEDDFFDIVTMLAVFEHIEPFHLVEVLQQIRRVLKPGGLYIMTTPAFWTDKLLRTMAKLRLVSPQEIQEHKDAYTHSKISDLLQKSGFRKENLKLGYFEIFMNIWATAER